MLPRDWDMVTRPQWGVMGWWASWKGDERRTLLRIVYYISTGPHYVMSRSLHYSSAHVLHVPNSMRADDYCREVEGGIMQLNTRRLNGRVNPLIHLSALFKGHPSPLSQPELLHLQCACGLVMVLIICCPILQFLIYNILKLRQSFDLCCERIRMLAKRI